MYKCSECGTEYNIAPKYCDCGNDIFINIDDENELIAKEMDVNEEGSGQTSKYRGRGRNFKQKSFSPVALSIFVICIVLSFLVLFVIANPKKDNSKVQIKGETGEEIEIPSVDAYWDNTPAKLAKKNEVQPQKQENILDKFVQQIIPQEQPKKEIKTVATAVKSTTPVQKKIVQVPIKTHTQKSSQKSTQSTQTSSKATTKSVSNQPSMTVEDLTNKIRSQYGNQTQIQNVPKQVVSTSQVAQTPSVTKTNAPLPNTSTTSTMAQNTQTSAQKSQNNTKTTTQAVNKTPVTAPVVKTKSTAQIKQELAAYKSNLRNSIGRKIDFTKVIGDGECALSFKVNSNGRLTSKAFTKQSSNITLNDAAFNALNTMTSFNPPPEGYNGETLRLNIKFYNGNFEISLN